VSSAGSFGLQCNTEYPPEGPVDERSDLYSLPVDSASGSPTESGQAHRGQADHGVPVRRLERELELARRIHSDHVVEVLGYGARDSAPYWPWRFTAAPPHTSASAKRFEAAPPARCGASSGRPRVLDFKGGSPLPNGWLIGSRRARPELGSVEWRSGAGVNGGRLT
jgi:hypothetical protein